MIHKDRVHFLFTQIADVVAQFILSAQSGFSEGWVPAAYIKEQLELKKSSYPQGNKIDNETGWLFATIARDLQDRGKVEFRKIGNRSYYRCK